MAGGRLAILSPYLIMIYDLLVVENLFVFLNPGIIVPHAYIKLIVKSKMFELSRGIFLVKCELGQFPAASF